MPWEAISHAYLWGGHEEAKCISRYLISGMEFATLGAPGLVRRWDGARAPHVMPVGGMERGLCELRTGRSGVRASEGTSTAQHRPGPGTVGCGSLG